MTQRQQEELGRRTIPKARLDALTDGVFAVAMTLLVIDLRLPEDFHPRDGAELLHRLGGLGNQVLVYVISFYVLGLRWIGLVQSGSRNEAVNGEYTRLALANLLIITFVPFATMMVGRYPSLAPAVWLYAAAIIVLALVALRMVTLEAPDPETLRQARIGLSTLIGAALLTVVLSLIVPKRALIAYALNLLDEPLRRLWRRRGAKRPA